MSGFRVISVYCRIHMGYRSVTLDIAAHITPTSTAKRKRCCCLCHRHGHRHPREQLQNQSLGVSVTDCVAAQVPLEVPPPATGRT